MSLYPALLRSLPSMFVVLFKKMYASLLHHRTISSFLLLAVIALSSYYVLSDTGKTLETVVATKGTIKQYVRVSGQVQSSRDANLSFQAGGVISFVGVKVGDVVRQGQVLATLSSSDAQASLLQAQASLENAEAVLGQITQGARKEELAVKQQAVDNAKTTLKQSYIAIPDALQNVDATTADVIKNKLAPLFVSTGDRYTLSFASCDQQLQSTIERQRSYLEGTLEDFQKKNSLVTTIAGEETIDVAFESAYSSALLTNELVNSISNLLLASCSLANPSLDGYRTSLSLVKTSMTALFSDITAKRTLLTNAKNTLAQTSRDLELTVAGADYYKVKAQKAVVSQAQAQVAQAKSGLSKTIISAPFPGTVADVLVSEGETASLGKTVISMIALNSFEVEAKIPEIDIAKIKVGSMVDVTLDAYGKLVVFKATVTRINPTATTEGSVPVYKVIITFLGQDPRIKSGMTANVNIITEEKNGVVLLPSRFITSKNDTEGTVVMLRDGKEIKREVSLGIRGDGGYIEIVTGLSDGDVVIPPTTTVRSSQKKTE